MLIKGIFTDVEVNNQPPEFARHLKNVLLTETLGTPVNEPGFTVCVEGSDLPYTVIGVEVIDETIIIWSTDNTNSEIGKVENCVYTTILKDANFTGQKLGFNTSAPIDSEYYLNFNGERIVAWIDDINEPRIINIDNFNVQELNDIRIFPFAASPNLGFEVQDSGGILESGTHQIVVAYANTNGLETNWFSLEKPVNITNSSVSENFATYDGVEAGTITSKAILINVEEADTRFDLIRIGVVKTINSIVTAQFIKEVPIASTSFSTIYTGSEGTIEDIALEEILVPSAQYRNAKAIGQVNNKLFLANLTVDEEIDLTDVAANTVLEWTSETLINPTSLAVPEGSNKNPANDTTFLPGEVYAFYLVGEKTDGTLTQAFHIPGREEVPLDKQLNTAAATAKLSDPPFNYEVDTIIPSVDFGGNNIYPLSGEFGYWENENEEYPIDEVIETLITAPAAAYYPFEDNSYLKPDLSTGAKSSDFYPGLIVTLQGFSNYNGEQEVLRTDFISGDGGFLVQLKDVPNLIGSGTISYLRTEVIENDLPTGKVRHHRFPTINAYRKAMGNNADVFNIGKTFFPRFGVKASNVNIPAELQDKIAKWFIVYAKRTPANATVVGQAMYQYAGCWDENYRETPGVSSANDTSYEKTFSSMVANFAIGNTRNSNNPGEEKGELQGLEFSEQFPHQQVVKFNSFDLLLGKPTIGSLYLRQEVKLSAANAFADQDQDDLENTITDLDSGVYLNRDNNSEPEPPGAQGNRTARWVFLNQEKQYLTSETQDEHLLREVESYDYLPQNVIANTTNLGLPADLRMSEDSLYLKVKWGHPTSTITQYKVTNDPDPNPVPPLDINIGYQIAGRQTDQDTSDTTEDTYLSTLCQRKTDVYSPFTEQEVVRTTNKALVTDTEFEFFGGDGRVSFTGIKQICPYAADFQDNKFYDFYTSPTAFGEGTMSIRYFGAYGTKNIGLRHTEVFNQASVYFPKTLDFYYDIFDVTLAGEYREILYNEDYSLNNEYNSIGTYNPLTIPAAVFLPHTIVSSVTQNVEERSISWQTFLAADRYVMPRDKGPIINLQGVGNERLFIHQRDSLFLTRSITRLKGDITDVTLGSGDLFDPQPAEVLSTDEGFGGTQHKFGCKLTKAGYLFTDAAQGKIFLHNGSQLEEISKNGQRIFFRDNIPKNLEDNPYLGVGITSCFDEKYNRLLVAVKNGSRSFTASYSPATQSWVSYHDYFPNFLIETRRALYSINNGLDIANQKGLFEHNVGAPGVYYNVVDDTPIPFPVLIDLVYNASPYENKTYAAVEWATEVIQADGIQAKDETIDYITLSNKTKTTGRVELERLVNLSQLHGFNTRNVNEFWSFNGIRDIAIPGIPFRLDFYDDFAIIDANLNYNKPWYRKAKFTDRFVVARFEYSNLNANKFTFLYHNINYRKSYR